MIKICKGRLSSMPTLFKSYKQDTITVQLFSERIIIFPDGTINRSQKENFAKKRGN